MSRLSLLTVPALATIAVLIGPEVHASPIVIDFTQLMAAYDVGRDYTYVEDGVIGRMNGPVQEWRPGIPPLQSNTADVAHFFAGGFASFTLAGGGDFSLISVDMLPDLQDGRAGPALWHGYFDNMLVASETVSTFGTFAFGDPWAHVDRVTVEFIQIGWLPPGAVWPESFSIDNLTLDDSPVTVPEPSTLALLGLGLAAVARHRRTARRRS